MAEAMTKTIIVKGSVDDIFNVWANFENFPLFMEHLKSVRRLDERLSHWVMEGPLGTKVEWDAETTRFEPNTRIGWNSKDNSAITTSGQVTFRELGPNETEVTVTMRYDPPAGALGEVLAQVFANPEKRVTEDLRRFKEYIEHTSRRMHDTATDSMRHSL